MEFVFQIMEEFALVVYLNALSHNNKLVQMANVFLLLLLHVMQIILVPQAKLVLLEHMLLIMVLLAVLKLHAHQLLHKFV